MGQSIRKGLLFQYTIVVYHCYVEGKLHKGWKSGKRSPVVRYYEYDADRDLCVRTTLDYMNKSWRSGQKKQLLLGS